ncbi:Mitochondrial Rho GTPase 2 [Vitis vinifera]|uniref:Mitochondrial Rho GTPase 2 n=1 Tax=Vitis vinifera TaxID=29760 RepID=A0A438F4J7_VITVI|nr:Mitochondrial Rho GTPase 2 [Vitis vinifera]
MCIAIGLWVIIGLDGALRHDDLDDLFSTAPESPWHEAPYRDAAERTAMGALSLNGFLSESVYSMMSFHFSVFFLLSNMECVVANSNYRPFSGNYTSTVDERYATNGIDELQGTRKTLILREIPEDRFKKFLSNKQSLAACDAAIFVYDSSDELSWRRATELLVEVARQGEETGFGVPCLLVAAKYDLDPFPMAAQDSGKVGAAIAVVGLAAYRTYAARKNTSS